MFSRQNLVFIALRLLNSCLFFENSGFFFNLNKPHKWSGILNCFSLKKDVFSLPINEWIGSQICSRAQLLLNIHGHSCWVVGRLVAITCADWRILITRSWRAENENEKWSRGEVWVNRRRRKNWLWIWPYTVKFRKEAPPCISPSKYKSTNPVTQKTLR